MENLRHGGSTMKNKKTLAIIFFTCFFFGTWFNSESQAATQENAKQKEMENYLRTAKVVSKSRAGGRGVNWILSLDDGKTARQGFFKTINRPRPTNIPDSYKYGIAAYELDKLLDLNLVPPVVEREMDGQKGSLQLFIGGTLKEGERRLRKIEPPDPKRFKNTLENLSVFENLIYSRAYCGERDLDDILIMDKEDWKVWRVDFSEAFDVSPELIPGCEITCCSKKLFQRLIGLDDNVIKAKLKHYINDKEMSMLLTRKKLIVKKIKQLIAEKGEKAVLFF
jgi:hypothetical protein